MRVFIATLGTETNTFASFPTGLDDFKHGFWTTTGIDSVAPSPWAMPAKRFRQHALDRGWEVVESLHAFAEPAGPTIRTAYEEMRDKILSDLRAAGQVDAVLMFQHGAMIAEGYDDCETDLTTRIREVVGKKTRIGLELDLHAHLDQKLVDACDLIVFYKAYPHIDYAERADDLFMLMERTLKGEIDPVMALFDCRVMGLFPTTREGPMVGFTEDLFAAEGKDGILSLSLNHGFPWADVPNAGAKMLAVADGDIEVAKRAAERFGRQFYESRAEATLPFVPFDEAIRRATEKGDRPLLLADTSDQTGGGAPGDTTYMIKALIDAGITDAVYAPLWDPLAVGICFELGVGAKLKLRIGGKYEPFSGPSLDVDAEILFLKRDAHQDQLSNEMVPMGDVAVIRAHGIEILLNTRRVGVFSPTMFTHHGITLEDKAVIGVKNLYKHCDVFAPLVREQLFVATPGSCTPDWKAIPFRRIPRPMWPLDDDPLG
jgi:microcystin degradation protein MlrC